MKINTVFNNFLAIEYIDLDNNMLAIYCKEKYRLQQQVNPRMSPYMDLSDPKIKPLVDAITQNINILHKDLGFRSDSRQEITNMWININNNIYIDGAHSHPGYFFSGTYYVKSDSDSGHINFLNPNRELISTILPPMSNNPNSFNCATIRHQPDPGKLIVFPSWLIHYVEHNLTEHSERISIAFNTKIIMPEGLMDDYK